jgi:adenylate kinase family enzyme
MTYNKIYIVGTVGSGKSFLAKQLSESLRIKHYDLDDIFWAEKFGKMREEKERNKLFRVLCNRKKWIIEGVYSTWIDYGIKKSDLVIVLDMRIYVLLWRIIKRTIKRQKSKQKGKARYRENWRDLMGLIRAAIRYRKKSHPRGYYKHMELIGKHKIKFVHMRSKRQIKRFLANLSKELA